jgi:hypothetical protein
MLQECRDALVVENLSLFHTVRRVLEQEGHALGLRPDILIYGEGKKIEASLGFLNDIADVSALQVHYAGDIDPEGWGIYRRLKQKYDGVRIRIALPFYEAMVRWRKTVPVMGGQTQDASLIENALDELRSSGGSEELQEAVKQCWMDRVRIPQEVLTVETMRMGVNDG